MKKEKGSARSAAKMINVMTETITIKGKYICDENFTTVYCNNAVYTIARNTGEWGALHVGERSAMGPVLDQATYDKWVAEAEREGTFTLR